MGTAISIEVAEPAGTSGPERAAHAIDGALAWLTAVDARFSTYRQDSEVCRMTRGLVADPSPDLRHVLDACERLRETTGGYFDAYATGMLDPSGYVKGWSAQVAADRLREAGFADFCLNAGGDVYAAGHAPDGGPWRIGIRHPFQAGRLAWVVAGSDLAVATSGTYERGAHVIDPHTGAAATYLCSVTVTGPDLGQADAYATAALAMGERGLTWLARLAGYESAAVTADGQAYTSASFPGS